MIRRLWDLLRSIALLPVYTLNLKRRSRRDKTNEQHLDTAYHYRYGPLCIYPYQVPQEIKAFLELIASRHYARVLEIGTSRGGTLHLFSRVLGPRATIVTIDLPGHVLRGQYARWQERPYRSFASADQ